MIEKIMIAVLIAIIVYLVKEFFSSKSGSYALKKENANLADENSQFQKEINKLKRNILKYEDKETIFAKYTKEKSGYYTHNETQKPFCPKCLQLSECRENELTKGEYNLSCESCDYSHTHKKLDIQIPPSQGNIKRNRFGL